MSLRERVVRGVLAGAAGTVALDATTYLDMALRKRPASDTPQQTVERLAALAGVSLPAEPGQRGARTGGVGALLGMAAGVSAGLALSLLRPSGARGGAPVTAGVAWALAMVVGNGPMLTLGITDPRTWSRTDWAADVVPHAAYAVVATLALGEIDRPRAGS